RRADARRHRLHLGARPPLLVQAREVERARLRRRDVAPRAGGGAGEVLGRTWRAPPTRRPPPSSVVSRRRLRWRRSGPQPASRASVGAQHGPPLATLSPEAPAGAQARRELSPPRGAERPAARRRYAGAVPQEAGTAHLPLRLVAV